MLQDTRSHDIPKLPPTGTLPQTVSGLGHTLPRVIEAFSIRYVLRIVYNLRDGLVDHGGAADFEGIREHARVSHAATGHYQT